MVQWEYDTIVMVLSSGAPALAEKLCTALKGLVTERNQLAEENLDLKKQLESFNLSNPENGRPEEDK